MRYIKIAVALLLLFFLGLSVFEQITKTGAKASRLSCHTKSTVFEKVHKPSLLKELQNALRSTQTEISVEALKAVYMPSKLFEYIELEDVRQRTKVEFERFIHSSTTQRQAKISIVVYENDKLDPGKKNEEAKRYAGYLIYRYYLGSELVYQIQVDFMDPQASDLGEKIACAVESVMSL